MVPTEIQSDPDYKEILGDDTPEEVIAKLSELHSLDAVKIDHVNRGEPQVCWSCGNEEKGFHLFKAEGRFYKLCDSCAQHYSTLLARLVRKRNVAEDEAAEAVPKTADSTDEE